MRARELIIIIIIIYLFLHIKEAEIYNRVILYFVIYYSDTNMHNLLFDIPIIMV